MISNFFKSDIDEIVNDIIELCSNEITIGLAEKELIDKLSKEYFTFNFNLRKILNDEYLVQNKGNFGVKINNIKFQCGLNEDKNGFSMIFDTIDSNGFKDYGFFINIFCSSSEGDLRYVNSLVQCTGFLTNDANLSFVGKVFEHYFKQSFLFLNDSLESKQKVQSFYNNTYPLFITLNILLLSKKTKPSDFFEQETYYSVIQVNKRLLEMKDNILLEEDFSFK